MAATKEGFLGKGWAFPVRPRNGRLRLTDQEEAIRNGIFLILSTAPGERAMRPGFGCGLADLVFRPNTPALRAAVRTAVRDALVRSEPRIDVLDVTVDPAPDAAHHLLIRVDYRVRTNNALFNLVYPFFLREGVG